MILKCTKCGGLYTADGSSQDVACSCSDEKTVLIEFNGPSAFDPDMDKTTVRLGPGADRQPESAPKVRTQRTNSVLFNLGLHAGAVTGDAEFGQYAIRGNAWSLPPVGLECAFRTSGQPEYFHPTIGFRLALDYPAKASH